MIVAYLTAITTLVSGVVFTLLYTRHNARLQLAVKANVVRRMTGMERNRQVWRTEAINGLVVLVVWHAMFVAWFTLWETVL